jgi:hypothetical protein
VPLVTESLPTEHTACVVTTPLGTTQAYYDGSVWRVAISGPDTEISNVESWEYMTPANEVPPEEL